MEFLSKCIDLLESRMTLLEEDRSLHRVKLEKVEAALSQLDKRMGALEKSVGACSSKGSIPDGMWKWIAAVTVGVIGLITAVLGGVIDIIKDLMVK